MGRVDGSGEQDFQICLLTVYTTYICRRLWSITMTCNDGLQFGQFQKGLLISQFRQKICKPSTIAEIAGYLSLEGILMLGNNRRLPMRGCLSYLLRTLQ